MIASSVIQAYMPYAPQGFRPIYVLETEIGATSLIRRAWERTDVGWRQLPDDYSQWPADMSTSPKVKFYITDKTLEIHANDKAVKFFDHRSLPNKSIQRTPLRGATDL